MRNTHAAWIICTILRKTGHRQFVSLIRFVCHGVKPLKYSYILLYERGVRFIASCWYILANLNLNQIQLNTSSSV